MYFDAASYHSAEFPLQRLKLPFFCVFMIPLFCALVFILWIESAAGAARASACQSLLYVILTRLQPVLYRENRKFTGSASGSPGSGKSVFCQRKARQLICRAFPVFLLPISFVFFVLHNRRKRFSAGIFRITVLQNGDHNRIISISQIVILRRVYYIVFCHLK